MSRVAVAKKKKKKERAPSETQLGRVMVILENVQDQQRLLGEAFSSLREEMIRRFEELEARLTSRIEALEQEQKAIQAELTAGAVYRDDPGRAIQLAQRSEQIEGELMAALERWDVLGQL